MTCGLAEPETVTAESRVVGGKWQGLGVVWGGCFRVQRSRALANHLNKDFRSLRLLVFTGVDSSR